MHWIDDLDGYSDRWVFRWMDDGMSWMDRGMDRMMDLFHCGSHFDIFKGLAIVFALRFGWNYC